MTEAFAEGAGEGGLVRESASKRKPGDSASADADRSDHAKRTVKASSANIVRDPIQGFEKAIKGRARDADAQADHRRRKVWIGEIVLDKGAHTLKGQGRARLFSLDPFA